MALEMKYFVLKPKSKKYCDRFAIASRRAMVEFARAIDDYDKELALELMAWVKREMEADDALLGKEAVSYE